MRKPLKRFITALAGLTVAGGVAVSGPVLGQVVAPNSDAPTRPAGPPSPAGAASGLLGAPLLQPAGTDTPVSGTSRDAVKVAPIKRVTPKTPPLPAAVVKATKVSAAASRGRTAKVAPLDAQSMALGAGASAAKPTCGPGQTFVRKSGQCQKRGQAATSRARLVAAKPKRK